MGGGCHAAGGGGRDDGDVDDPRQPNPRGSLLPGVSPGPCVRGLVDTLSSTAYSTTVDHTLWFLFVAYHTVRYLS